MCDADHIEANVCEIINSTLLQHDKRNKKFQMPTGFIYRHIFFHICARRFSFYVITRSIIEQTEQNKYKTIIKIKNTNYRLFSCAYWLHPSI